MLIDISYVINSEAMKKLYKTMKGRPGENKEARDLAREWHSDSMCSWSKKLKTGANRFGQVSSKIAHRISASCECKTHLGREEIPSGVLAMNCKSVKDLSPVK